jgi:predicted 3-demethylubiquinone-9 3-methyltransferase (glyoxalase superfamily)
MSNPYPQITTFLMFSGQAEEAMNFYISLFEGSEIVHIQRYGANEAGAEGSVMQAAFTLNGQLFRCMDSNVKHAFTFTPSISLFVDIDSVEQLEYAFSRLSEEGMVLMPLAEYPFSKKFGWVQDRFGVSWQLKIAN